RVLDRPVRVQAGRHPRAPEPLRGHRDQDRDLHRPLHRVVRRVPQPNARRCEDRHPGSVPSVDNAAASIAAHGSSDREVPRLEQQPRLPVTAPRTARKGSIMADWLSSTDHKVIGHLYLITSFGFFMAGGLMAMIMRAQLFEPDNHIVSDQQYNELFTMHGTIMLLLFA